MKFRYTVFVSFLLGAMFALNAQVGFGQDLRQIQDPAQRMQLQHALRTLRSQMADMPAFSQRLSASKTGDDSLGVGGISGHIHGIAETDSAWVLAVAAHLLEDPTAWALGQVDADGAYHISGLRNGIYIVMAGADGFLPQFFSQAYWIWEAHPVEVFASEMMGGIDFFLEPTAGGTGSITGRVLDAQDESPIAGATIYAHMANNPFFSASTHSNDDGSYALTDLRAGEYWVYAYAEGYFESEFGDSLGVTRTLVRVADGEETAGIDFRMNRGGTISGRITDAAGMPIAGANVEAYPSFSVEPGYADEYRYGWTTTDEDGAYTISGLTGGSYFVSTHVYGRFYNITRWFDDADHIEDATPVDVAFGEDTPGIDITIDVTADTGSLAGRVVTEDGDPVQNAWLRLEPLGRPNYYYYGYANPDANGNYVFEEVPVGTYRVILEYWTQWFYGYVWYDGVTNPEDATPVEIAVDQRTEGIDFTIPTADGVLSGMVTDEAGKPIANAYIQVNRPGFGNPYEDIYLWAYANTDKDGRFSIDHIPDGEYHVSVFYCYIHECVQQWWPGTDNPEDAEIILVTDGQSTPAEIDFALPLALGDASISGVIKNLDGDPLAGAQVSVMPFSNITPGIPEYWSNQLYTTTDSLGQYSFDYLPAETYLVHTTYWEEGGYAEQWYDGAETAPDGTPIPLADGEARTDIDFTLDVIPLYGTVSGTVSFEDGEPIRRAYVEVVSYYRDYDAALWWPYEHYAITNDAGEFSIDNLYEGEYQLNVFAQGAEGIVDDSLGGGQTIHIKIARGETTVVDALMRRQQEGPGSISGLVTGDEGDVLDVAIVQAMPVVDFGAPYYTAIADENGAYTIENLPEGQYYVKTRAPWRLTEFYDDAFDPSEAQLIDVPADRPVTGIDVELSPLYILAERGGDALGESDQGAFVFGTVTDDRGEPLADATVYVVNEAGQALLSAQTHEDGMYEIAGVPPGTSYRLKATHVGYESRFNDNARAAADAPGITMNGSRLEVNFTLAKSNTSTGTDDETPLPAGLALLGNYPNPFRSQTTINLTVSEPVHVSVTVYDALGREIHRLFEGVMPAGSHALPWDASGAGLSSGLYFYRVVSTGGSLSGKMMFME